MKTYLRTNHLQLIDFSKQFSIMSQVYWAEGF